MRFVIWFQKRVLFFEIQKETDPEVKKVKIQEYLDNNELQKLKKEKLNLKNVTEINYMVQELPKFTKQTKEDDNTQDGQTTEEPKKKKIIKKRCPPGQRKNKKTGECEPKTQ